MPKETILVMSDDAYARFRRINAIMMHKDEAETFQKALAVYEFCVNAHVLGHEIVHVADGVSKLIDIK